MQVTGKKAAYSEFVIKLETPEEIHALRAAMIALRSNATYSNTQRAIYSELYNKLYSPDKMEE